jgi:predicted metal-dependent HD superfamily phosphohydrolase
MNNTLRLVRDFVAEQFKQNNQPNLFYHSFEHTLYVVRYCELACTQLKLNDEDSQVLLMAAWLHDVGYLHTLTRHEAKSIELAKDLLKFENPILLQKVIDCIAATEIGVKPKTELSAILKDIDVAYGVATDFEKVGNLLRQEWATTLNKIYSDEEWQQIQKDFLDNLEFYSDYGKRTLRLTVDERCA